MQNVNNSSNNEQIDSVPNDYSRSLKIKMNKQNMKYFFENNPEIHPYLYSKMSSFTTSSFESVYLDTIFILNNKTIDENMIFDEIMKIVHPSHNFNEKYYNSIINRVIDDYNDFYLNDDYYYDGYWYDDEWIKNEVEE